MGTNNVIDKGEIWEYVFKWWCVNSTNYGFPGYLAFLGEYEGYKYK